MMGRSETAMLAYATGCAEVFDGAVTCMMVEYGVAWCKSGCLKLRVKGEQGCAALLALCARQTVTLKRVRGLSKRLLSPFKQPGVIAHCPVLGARLTPPMSHSEGPPPCSRPKCSRGVHVAAQPSHQLLWRWVSARCAPLDWCPQPQHHSRSKLTSQRAPPQPPHQHHVVHSNASKRQTRCRRAPH
jgi:hypothetical protein